MCSIKTLEYLSKYQPNLVHNMEKYTMEDETFFLF